MPPLLRTLAALAALALPARLAAQETPPVTERPPVPASGELVARIVDGRQVYDAAEFARFRPRTALDMARQLPGFQISGSDDDQRGLGQASQNVLISGRRISGKSNDAESALGRIAADAVERLELVDGATLGIPGLSGQVLNVVAAIDSFSGSFRYSAQQRRFDDVWGEGELSVTGLALGGEYTLGLSNDPFRFSSIGPEVTRDGGGALLFTTDELARTRLDRPRVTAGFGRTAANGNVLNLNAAGGLVLFRENVVGTRRTPGAADADERFAEREREWNAELSGDYELGVLGGRLKLIALQRFEHSPRTSRFVRDDGVAAVGSRFERETDEGESILRGEFRWSGGRSDWSLSLEGAYNFLDTAATLAALDGAGSFAPVPLAGATAKVTEKRGESLLSWSRALAGNLRVQAVAGGEVSEIEQAGAGGLTRFFFRPKGSLTLAWQPSSDLDLTFRLERQVGQLDFFDFVASVDVADNADNAANPRLVPPQSWRAQVEARKSLGAWGNATATLYGERISDIIDVVPIGTTRQALGNLDRATRTGVELIGTLLFDPIGWRGAKLDLEAERRWSDLVDPLLGLRRPVNGDLRHRYRLALRHDVPSTPYAWGAQLDQRREDATTRLDQFSERFQSPASTALFVEHKDVAGLTVRAAIGNLLGGRRRFARTVFADRRDGPVAFTEDSNREVGLVGRLTVSGSF